MKTFLTRNIKRFANIALATAVMGGFMLLVGAPRAFADDDDCQHRVAKADHKLHEAAEHHGWNSKQADRARHELQEAREYCWSRYHKWWDEDGHRWHSDHDWDDHDHDRGRDEDHH
ncbi:MAG: hypothetical protein ACRD50_05920 [Candidatus Acidiferrales bacterium]